MIEVYDLKKTYRDRTVLDLPALSLRQGETLALAGANGSGKTTLLRLLAGTLKPTAGTVKTAAPVLYLPQKSYAFRGTVLQNVLLGTNGRKQQAMDLLEQLELLSLADKKASSLSGGELQRLSVCRLLIRPCNLLLLDEPTSACDPQSAALVLQALATYREQTGCTLVLSTHTPRVALEAAERLLILRDGKPEADGAPQTLLQSPGSDWMRAFVAGWRI